MLMFSLILRAIKKYFDNAQPKADVDTTHHQTSVRTKIEGERIKYNWHHSAPNSGSKNVIWWWHGFGSEEDSWITPGLFSSKQWLSVQGSKEYPIGLMDDDPHVFCISFDKKWLVSPDKDRRRGERDAVVSYIKVLMDELEKKFLPDGIGKRIGIGVSMGGHNLMQMYHHLPADYWDGIILHNALMKDFEDNRKLPADLLINTEFKRGTFDRLAPNGATGLALLSDKHSSIQIQSSRNDEFGFHPPALKYHDELIKKGIKSQLVLNGAGHHDLDDVAAAEYINNIFSPPTPAQPLDNNSTPLD